jgi:hypothetical protein
MEDRAIRAVRADVTLLGGRGSHSRALEAMVVEWRPFDAAHLKKKTSDTMNFWLTNEEWSGIR